MSAVRRNDRRATRNNISSPYKRPTAQPKKSGWSFSSLFSLFNPLRSRESEEPEAETSDSVESEDGEEQQEFGAEPQHETPAQTLSQRGRELAQTTPQVLLPPLNGIASGSQATGTVDRPITISSPPSTPGPLSGQTMDSKTSSPLQNFKAVKEFLASRPDDQPLHQVEYVGLVTLLKDSVQDDDDGEPFRFSTSPTPSRAVTPAFTAGAAGPSAQTPRRTLTKNPNGVYKWQGGGSARPRNRYQSPAFGPPRPSPSKIKLSPPESPKKTDTKRRRVGADAESSTPQRVNAPAPSTPSSSRVHPVAGPSTSPLENGSPSKHSVNGTAANGNGHAKPTAPSTPRLRMSIPPKPTTPAIPSPLRNTWGMNDSSPPQASHQPKQPTQAANFMSQLIKEATPPKKPDVSNPYQTASPVKVPVKKTNNLKKRKAQEVKPPIEKTVDLSPQRIIEATVPKGSKRARPPPELERKSAPAKSNGVIHPTTSAEPPRRSARLKSPTPPRTNGSSNGRPTPIIVEDEPEVEEEPSPKKQKTVRGAPTIEEIEDVDMPAASPTTSAPQITRPTEVVEPSESTTSAFDAKPATNGSVFGSPSKSFSLKSSAPKEPSKLRFGFAADTEEVVESKPASSPFQGSSSTAFGSSSTSFGSSTTAFGSSGPSAFFGASTSQASSVFGKPDSSLGKPSESSLEKPAESPFGKPSEPSFGQFAKPTTKASEEKEKPSSSTSPSAPATTPSKVDPKEAAKALDLSSLPVLSFTFPMKVYPPEHIKERDEAKAMQVSSLPSFDFLFGAPAVKAAPVAFDWAKAGMKAPEKAAGAKWTCGTCMLSNPDSAVECTVCEAPRP